MNAIFIFNKKQPLSETLPPRAPGNISTFDDDEKKNRNFSVEMTQKNVASAVTPLNPKECEALNKIRKLFENLPIRHWEGVEVLRYQKDPEEFRKFLHGPQKTDL